MGRAYKKLIEQWRHIPLLQNGPLTLVGHWGEEWQQQALDEGQTDGLGKAGQCLTE